MATASDLNLELEEVLQEIHTCTQLNISPSIFDAKAAPQKFTYTVCMDPRSYSPPRQAPPPPPSSPPPPCPEELQPQFAQSAGAEKAAVQSAAARVAMEHLAVASLVQIVAQYQPSGTCEGLLLSDFGSLLPEELRLQVKGKLGGLRTLIARYPEVFDLRGEPGKEHVKLAASGEGQNLGRGSSSRRGSRDSDLTATPHVPRRSAQSRRSSRESASTLPQEDLHDSRTRRSSRDSQLTAASSRRAGPAVPTLRLRGLPFAAEAPDVVQFLAAAGVDVAEDQVEMVRMRDGRTTGFAAVAFGEDGYEAAAAAQAKLHMQSVGGRYVEVFLKMVTSSRSSKENTSFESSTASPSDDSRSAFLSSSGSEDITEERATEELLTFIQAQGAPVLLSMLGVAAGDAARRWMRDHGLGLKQLLQKHPDLFVLEGEKGKQAVRLAQAPIPCPAPEFPPPGPFDGFGVDPAVAESALAAAFAQLSAQPFAHNTAAFPFPFVQPPLFDLNLLTAAAFPPAFPAAMPMPSPHAQLPEPLEGAPAGHVEEAGQELPALPVVTAPPGLADPSPCVVTAVRLRGLPFTAEDADVWAFLDQPDHNCQAWILGGRAGVQIVRRRNGRATGQAVLQLATPMRWEAVRAHLHMRSMGDRYIEVLEG